MMDVYWFWYYLKQFMNIFVFGEKSCMFLFVGIINVDFGECEYI